MDDCAGEYGRERSAVELGVRRFEMFVIKTRPGRALFMKEMHV